MWTVSDDPQQSSDQIQNPSESGVTRIFLHSAQNDQQKVIDFFGQQVLSKARSGQTAAL